MARELRSALENKRRIEADLAKVELQVYNLETSYFDESAGYDLVRGLKGFDKSAIIRKGSVPATISDRIFSLSSVTSPLGALPFPASGAPTVPPPVGAASADISEPPTRAAIAAVGGE